MSKRLTKKYTFLQEDASKETENYHENICHFTICIFPLIEMFHSRPIDHKISKLHEEALRIVYKDHFSSFEELLSKDKSVTAHQRNLQILVTEMYKILNGL